MSNTKELQQITKKTCAFCPQISTNTCWLTTWPTKKLRICARANCVVQAKAELLSRFFRSFGRYDIVAGLEKYVEEQNNWTIN